MKDYTSTIKMAAFRIHIGKTYDTFAQLETDIKLLERELFVNIRKSDGHKIETQRKYNKCLNMKDELVYKDITFSCKHSGAYKAHKTTGERASSSCKKKCPFQIKFRATEDGQSLKCTSFINKHEHDLNAEEFAYHPTQRKLSKATQEDIARRCLGKEDKKLLQNEYSKLTGQKILVKDIQNIAQRAKKEFNKKDENKTEARDLDDWIKERYPSVETEYVIDNNNIMTGLFFQDAEMKSTFSRFPEVLLVDATHKVNNLNMPLYAMLAIDGNGESQIVGFYLTQDETEPSIRAMVNLFKKNNPAWVDIKVAEYYMKNWHPIREEWVEGLKQKQFNLQERTNNRIE